MKTGLAVLWRTSQWENSRSETWLLQTETVLALNTPCDPSWEALQNSPLQGNKAEVTAVLVVAAGVSTSSRKAQAQQYLTQQQSSTKREGPSAAQHLEGSTFPRKSAAFTPKPASPKSCWASFRHTSLGSNRSTLFHVPVVHRVDVSMPFPASKMSRLLKKS